MGRVDPQLLRRRIEQGVALTYSVEDSPLGTAGSVMLALSS